MNEQGEIFKLIPKVMKSVGFVSKDRKNEQQKYSFRGIEDFYAAAHPAMIEHGIFCAPKVLSRDVYRFEKTNDQGRVTAWMHVSLEVEHRFYAGDGSHVDVTTWGEGLDNSDKATNKAMSGAMKYALIELFCVPTKDVEDSDRESPETGVKRNGNVKRLEEDIPLTANAGHLILPPAEQRITSEQAGKWSKRFREALPEYMQPKADVILHDWLGQKMYLDEHGNPSKLAVLKNEFERIGKESVAFAKSFHPKLEEAPF